MPMAFRSLIAYTFHIHLNFIISLLQICLILNSKSIFPWPMFQPSPYYSLVMFDTGCTLEPLGRFYQNIDACFDLQDNDVIPLNCGLCVEISLIK